VKGGHKKGKREVRILVGSIDCWIREGKEKSVKKDPQHRQEIRKEVTPEYKPGDERRKEGKCQ